MTVAYLSPIGNGFQFFDTSGKPLNAGKLYTYSAGTVSQVATYTTSAAAIANANPIILNTDGRPPNEIWLTPNQLYKFALQDSTGAAIPSATYDNLYGLANFTGSINLITTVKDFGAIGDGVTDDTVAIQAAVDSGTGLLYFQAGNYLVGGSVNITKTIRILGSGMDFAMTGTAKVNITTNSASNNIFKINANNVVIEGINFTGLGSRALNGSLGNAIQVGTVTRTVTDGAMTAGIATLTSVTASFTSADVGSYVRVTGAYNGTSTQYIVALLSGTQVTLSAVADNPVAGATSVIAPVILATTLRDSSMSSHSVGINFLNASNFTLDNCHLNSFYAVQINSVAPDKGDSEIIGCHLSAPTLANAACISWFASGGLKITNCKFLDCYYSILMNWNVGNSGGPLISNCSFENMTNFSIYCIGDSVHTLSGFSVTGCFINGGTRSIHIDDTLPLTNLTLTGNMFLNGSANTMVYIGALCNSFTIDGNIIDGANVAVTGINIANGALNGLIGNNNIKRLTSTQFKVANNNVSVLWNEYSEGSWIPVLTFATPGNLVVAYQTQYGTYTRSGNLVRVNGNIITSTFTQTNASGELRITGLPYTVKSTVSSVSSLAVGPVVWQGITKANYTNVACVAAVNTNLLNLKISGSGQTSITVSSGDLPSGGNVSLQFTNSYEV